MRVLRFVSYRKLNLIKINKLLFIIVIVVVVNIVVVDFVVVMLLKKKIEILHCPSVNE